MAKVTNTTKSDLAYGAVGFPAGASVEIDDKALAEARKAPSFESWFKSGALTVEGNKPKPFNVAGEPKADETK